MKVGDEVYCIKTINNWFFENNFYNILSCDYNTKNIIISIKSNYRDIPIYFNLTRPEQDIYAFKDHFITKCQLRKIKIQNLYEKR
jgi:hypothetical protein